MACSTHLEALPPFNQWEPEAKDKGTPHWAARSGKQISPGHQLDLGQGWPPLVLPRTVQFIPIVLTSLLMASLPPSTVPWFELVIESYPIYNPRQGCLTPRASASIMWKREQDLTLFF